MQAPRVSISCLDDPVGVLRTGLIQGIMPATTKAFFFAGTNDLSKKARAEGEPLVVE